MIKSSNWIHYFTAKDTLRSWSNCLFVRVRVLTAKPPPHQERAPKALENYKASCPHSLWPRNSYASMRTLTILPAMQAELKVP